MENTIGKDWLIAYTYTNAEKKIYTRLKDQEIHSYLPLQRVIRQWSRGEKELEVPLFPNYIFVNVTKKERWKILSMPGVARFLTIDGSPSIIKENELEVVRNVLASTYKISVEADLEVGDRVKVLEGSLSGLEGFLVEKKGEKRFVVNLKGLNKVLSMNISKHLLVKQY